MGIGCRIYINYKLIIYKIKSNFPKIILLFQELYLQKYYIYISIGKIGKLVDGLTHIKPHILFLINNFGIVFLILPNYLVKYHISFKNE